MPSDVKKWYCIQTMQIHIVQLPNSENAPFFSDCKAKMCLGDCKLQIFKTAV